MGSMQCTRGRGVMGNSGQENRTRASTHVNIAACCRTRLTAICTSSAHSVNMSRLMEEYTRKAAAYEAALSKIASTNRPVNSTALLWEIKETLYAGVGKGSQASSPSDLQTLHRALNGSRVISLGAKLTQQLATVAEEAENAGVIERLGPQKAREARLALGQALCLCLDGIADAGRGLTHVSNIVAGEGQW